MDLFLYASNNLNSVSFQNDLSVLRQEETLVLWRAPQQILG
jgi:hypothetical protein